MKLEQAVLRTIDEDTFYDMANDAYQVYKSEGGSALNQDEYLKVHRAGFKPWHVAKKEKEFKKKLKLANDKIKEKVYEYFFTGKKK